MWIFRSLYESFGFNLPDSLLSREVIQLALEKAMRYSLDETSKVTHLFLHPLNTEKFICMHFKQNDTIDTDLSRHTLWTTYTSIYSSKIPIPLWLICHTSSLYLHLSIFYSLLICHLSFILFLDMFNYYSLYFIIYLTHFLSQM